MYRSHDFQRGVEQVAQSAVRHRAEQHKAFGLIEQLLQLLLRFRPHAQLFQRVDRGLREMEMQHRLFAGFDPLGLQFDAVVNAFVIGGKHALLAFHPFVGVEAGHGFQHGQNQIAVFAFQRIDIVPDSVDLKPDADILRCEFQHRGIAAAIEHVGHQFFGGHITRRAAGQQYIRLAIAAAAGAGFELNGRAFLIVVFFLGRNSSRPTTRRHRQIRAANDRASTRADALQPPCFG